VYLCVCREEDEELSFEKLFRGSDRVYIAEQEDGTKDCLRSLSRQNSVRVSLQIACLWYA
jgi:hypothetical protein